MSHCLADDLRFRTTQQSQTGEGVPLVVEADIL